MGWLNGLKGVLGGKPTQPPANAPPAAAREPERQLRELEELLKVAEQKLLKHELDELTYRQLYEETQSKMIGLEATLELEKAGADIERLVREKAAKLPPSFGQAEKFRAALREKHWLDKALEVANRKYLKRQLREETFLNLSRTYKKKAIEAEARANEVNKEMARQIMVATQAKLALAGVEERPLDVDEEAEEIAEQLPRTPAAEGWPKTEPAAQAPKGVPERRHGRERGVMRAAEKSPTGTATAAPTQAPSPTEQLPRRLRHRH